MITKFVIMHQNAAKYNNSTALIVILKRITHDKVPIISNGLSYVIRSNVNENTDGLKSDVEIDT